MRIDISKLCADYLRTSYKSNIGGKLKASHARELIAAFFGYKSHAALLSEKLYPLNNLEEAYIFIPDVPLIEHRRSSLKEVPDDLFLSIDIASGIGEFLTSEGLTGADIWVYENLETYITEVLLIDSDSYISDELSGVMAETNAGFYDYPDYENVRTLDKGDYLDIRVSGSHSGTQLEDKPFSGDTINFEVCITLPRIAGKRGFLDYEIEIGGGVNDDWVDPELKHGTLSNIESPLASELGISVEDLESLEWEVQEIASDDDFIYGYLLIFEDHCPLEILQKIDGLTEDFTVRVSVNAFDEPEGSGY